ncbi:MAG TPA: DNA methyltransferase [Acetobacteraceae bacterium]|nr:DNA methyltransferase [Acetobacteraceae bacterium]
MPVLSRRKVHPGFDFAPLVEQSAGQIFLGDAFDLFDRLADESVDMIVTSPPYWGHREYGLEHNWNFFNNIQNITANFTTESPGYAWYRDHDGVLGLEPYPEWYVAHLCEIFQKAHRCLKPSGSVWVNIGDTYFARWASIRENGRQGLSNQGRIRRKTPMGGIRQEKQLLLVPSRFAIAMQEAGWILRNDLIWHKPNATPRPEGDRLRLAHEHFFHFVKRPKEGRAAYYYDSRFAEPRQSDVVTVNVAAGEEGHTATFPRNLIIPRILSSSPPGGLVLDPFCGTGRALEVALEFGRQIIGFDKCEDFWKVAREKVNGMARPARPARKESGNYISEWFGRRVYPVVKLDGIKSISGANKDVCPFLTEALARKTECWKSANSKGVCTISSVSNRTRQDWLVCPHRVIHTDIVKESCARIFGTAAAGRYPVPVSALATAERLESFKTEIRKTGSGFLFFQDKLGGEISFGGTDKSPEMAFDITLVEILPQPAGQFALGRYGIMEIQTMDFHGSYRDAVSALNNALDLHGDAFPTTLQLNIDWAGRGVEGPNIANVFKRTFYQMMIKFQLSTGAAAAGTVLALPRSVWDSWQPFLGAPVLVPTTDGDFAIAGAPESALNSYICLFDLDASAGDPDPDATGVAGAKDISPVRIQSYIRVDPQTLAHYAFAEVPKEILNNISGMDLIMASIRTRLARWWPEISPGD